MGTLAFSVALFAKPYTVGNKPGKVRSFNVQEIVFRALLFQLPPFVQGALHFLFPDRSLGFLELGSLAHKRQHSTLVVEVCRVSVVDRGEVSSAHVEAPPTGPTL